MYMERLAMMRVRVDQPANHNVDAVRGFNRFYTRQIGVLREGLLQSPFSLTEVRILYEIANRQQPTASELCQALGLDPGYLSRILSKLEKQGLVRKSASKADGRQSLLALKPKGQKTFAALDARQRDEIAVMLRPLSPASQAQLIQAMNLPNHSQCLQPMLTAPIPKFTVNTKGPCDSIYSFPSLINHAAT